MSDHKTYEQMHSGLHWARGRAREHVCIECGKKASDWAYRYVDPTREIVDDKGRRYSENFDDYSPMCRSCHRRFDMLRPERREFQLEHLQRINAKASEDPGYSDKMRARALKGNEVLRQRRAQGLPVGKRSPEGLIELGKQVGNLKRVCSECGMKTSAGPLVRHQKISGHEGWEPA